MAPHFVTCVQPTYSFCSLPRRLTHTHAYTQTSHPPNKPDLWYLAASAARWCEEAAATECDLSSALPEVNGSGKPSRKVTRRVFVTVAEGSTCNNCRQQCGTGCAGAPRSAKTQIIIIIICSSAVSSLFAQYEHEQHGTANDWSESKNKKGNLTIY